MSKKASSGTQKDQSSAGGKLSVGPYNVTTYAPPPPDFDFLAATPRALSLRGLPQRPDPRKAARLHQHWLRMFSRRPKIVVPRFELRPAHIPPRKHKAIVAGNILDTQWSGAAILPNDDPVVQVAGQWTVPHVYGSRVGGAIRPYGTQFFVAAWIGIDGIGDNVPLVQAGCSCTATLEYMSDPTQTYLWWEWLSPGGNEPSVQLSSPTAAPGDCVWCMLTATSDTEVQIAIGNLTSQIATSFTVSAPTDGQPANLLGNSAEWIVEAPAILVNGTLEQTLLCNYGDIYFDNMNAGLQSGHGVPGTFAGDPSVNWGSLFTMVDPSGSGNPISVPVIEGEWVMKLTFVGAF